MRKRLFFVASLLVGLFITINLTMTQAETVDELTELADHFPEDTLVYAAIRTDDGYIETLNGLIQLVDANTGGYTLSPVVEIPPVPELLNELIFAGTADLSWLGDTAAIGVSDLSLEGDGDATLLIAFAVTDPDAAIETFQEMFGGEGRTGRGGVMFAMGDLFIGVGEDGVVFISNSRRSIMRAFAPDDTLNDNDNFTETLALLPADGYNAVIYIDAQQLNEQVVEAFAMMGDDDPTVDFMIEQLDPANSGVAGFGLTILDGRTLDHRRGQSVCRSDGDCRYARCR